MKQKRGRIDTNKILEGSVPQFFAETLFYLGGTADAQTSAQGGLISPQKKALIT